jgi:hypothetical protein
MRPLDLNLSSRPFRNDTLLAAFYIVTGVLLLVWAVMAPLRYSGLLERKEILRAELQEMRVGTQSFDEEAREYEAKIQTLPLEEMRERSEFAREVLEHRNFSWTTLFNNLEEPGVVPCDVRLMSLRPRYVENVMFIDVRGVSRNGHEGYSLFVRSLQDNPHFYSVNPRNLRRSPENSGYIFDMSFSYFPDPDAALPEELLRELEIAKEKLEKDEEAGAAPAEGEESAEDADGSEEPPALETETLAEEGFASEVEPGAAAAGEAEPAAPRATGGAEKPVVKPPTQDRPRRRRRPVQRDPGIPRPEHERDRPEGNGSGTDRREGGDAP